MKLKSKPWKGDEVGSVMIDVSEFVVKKLGFGMLEYAEKGIQFELFCFSIEFWYFWVFIVSEIRPKLLALESEF
jgi:hypothetical protein